MKKYLGLAGLLLVTGSLVGLTSCDSTNYDIFFSEYFSGTNSIYERAVEIGTTSTEGYSLEGYTFSIIGRSDSVRYTYTFTDETITSTSLIIFINPYMAESYDNPFDATLITMDDNYLITNCYMTLTDATGNIVDQLGYSTAAQFLSEKTAIRLNEYHYGNGGNYIDTSEWINYRPDYIDNLGILDCPISYDELMEGPTLEYERYTEPFAVDGKATNGWAEVTVISLVDGDTTYFDFPDDAGVDDSTSSNRVRYLLIDTPEIQHGDTIDEQAYGEDAKDFTNARLEAATLIVCQSSSDAGLTETYGRYLGFVWYTTVENPTYDDLILLNWELVKNGLAYYSAANYPTLYSNDILYEDYFVHAEYYAEKNELNIHS